MAHIKDNIYPYQDWKQDFPNISFPSPRDGLDFPEQEIFWVHPTEQPEYDPETHYVVEGPPVFVDDQWQQTWEIIEIPVEPEYVPEEVKGWQAEVAMRATPVDSGDPESQNVWERVQEIIAAMPDGIEKITAQTVLSRGKIRRDSPMLAQLAPLVPLSQERVDDLMRLAASIQA
ncbi:MAG: hypothetical protein M0P09_06730 [Acholeplasmataceae bacterium]|nr:hypothetical protein [Acholeplasmataceae bacterium]